VLPEVDAALKKGATVVTAGSRLSRSLRAGFARARQAEGKRAWTSPDILPWNEWVMRRWHASSDAPPPLNGTQEESLWRRVIESRERGLIHTGGAARAAMEAWLLLHQYRLPREHPLWLQSRETAAFRQWSHEYGELTARLDRIDAARLPDRIRPAPAYLAGFDTLTPQQEALFARAPGTVRVGEGAARCRAPVLATLPDQEAEIEAAAAWARDRLDRQVGIIVPDLHGARKTVDRVFRSLVPGAYHISLGTPIAEHPMVAAALNMLELAVRPAPIDSATRVLLSPFARGDLARRALRDVEMRREGLWEASLESVGAFPEAAAAASALPRQQTASRWALSFSSLLAAFGWPGRPPVDFEAASSWQDVLADFSSLDTTVNAMTAGSAIDWLRRCAASRTFEPANRGEPVQILGTLEAAGSEFDALWITGFDSESWPPAASPNPFLPLALQRERDVPNSSPEQALAFARRVTARLLSSAAEIVVSHAETAEDRPLRPSPLVAHLAERKVKRPQPAPPRRPATEPFEDPAAPPLEVSGAAPGGARILELQSHCPFRAFAETRLRARPMEHPDPGLDPRGRGVLIHEALAHLMAAIGDSSRLAGPAGAEIAEAVEHALRRMADESAFGKRLREIERRRLTSLLERWLDVERERRVQFQVVGVEVKREVEVGGLRIVTRIDRVDRLPDRRSVLIDYKLTAPSPEAWEGERPDSPQLPLYAVTHEEALAAVAFAQVSTAGLRFRGVSAAAGALPKADEMDGSTFASRVAAWRDALETLAADYCRGEATVDPKDGPKTCEHCHLPTLCRIAD